MQSRKGSSSSGSTDQYIAESDDNEKKNNFDKSQLNISTANISKQFNSSDDYPLNSHLKKLYLEQERRKRSQERRRKFVNKWGLCCCCILS